MLGFGLICKGKNLMKEIELINTVYEIIEQKNAAVVAATSINA